MPEAATASAIDMDSYLPDQTDHSDDDIKDLDFGNELTDDAPEETVNEAVEETAKEVVEEVVEEAVEEAVEETAEETAEEVVEEDVEEDVEETVEAVEEPETKKHMIPKRRLDDVVAKQRKAENEAAELRKELAEVRAAADAAPDVDILELSERKSTALLDGDLKESARLEKQMLDSYRQPVAEVIDMDALEARVEAKLELKSTLETVFTEFPQLDTDSDQFDEDLNSEAVVFQQAYINQGYSPAEAVRRAANAAIRVVRPELLSPKEVKPTAKPRKTNIKGNIEASNAQPPKMNQGESGGKSSSEMIDINKLTDEEFDALPEATRARMRGDLV